MNNNREDHALQKRVELHCHTNMSEMDGVSDVRNIIKRAVSWGHKAVAITDHGVVQAFPDAYEAVPEDSDFKVIYGMEAYLVDETGKSLEKEQVKGLKPYHAVILIANETGRVNLYRLVSYAHLEYFNRVPLIPKSLLGKYQEGLILGSADEAGEVYQALLKGASDEELSRIVGFYDYLEIQPVGEKSLNQRIVQLGEQYDKPVVATGDVHFLDPEDEIYRNILLANRNGQDDEHEAPLYFRTTEEMLDEFAYLGEEKAYEVVVTNTNLIADRIERIVPIRTDKCYPVIEDADQALTKVCCDAAHKIYGDPLPAAVRDRLTKELHPILRNGFSSLYMIARMLVLKSNEDGYPVGSRGCAGASFAAYLAGITEVNPLPPHYVCPVCHYSDFDSYKVLQYEEMAGYDMPDRLCPNCGARMNKAGFDIPYETFLGFNGEKEPDFDLNFSGMYQYRAHKYAEEIFGKDHTFRAGTIGTVQERTARGYVLHYLEERGETKKNCEINRLAEGCIGVKYATGQHPGGIIVLPEGEEICSFTPVQHPANDPDSDIVTTHFDYHSIDHSLLKLDILGHDDPTMLHMLQKLTGVDPTTVPLDDPKVLSLFTGTEALGITPDDIGGIPLGTLGIPEFGTEYSMEMLTETHPTAFSELVRCIGLLHGTGVWQGNAQKLIRKGKAAISNVIGTRDDIMTYLISCGLDRELSYMIMESVRKGKGLKPGWEEEMKSHGVPDWYIWSCSRIRYMFPRSHAAAYLIQAWRIAYYKVYYPAAFYAAYFSIRGYGFDYEMMCMGKEHLLGTMKDYEQRKDSLSHRERDTYNDMKVVREMYARGLNFVPINLYRADPHDFQIAGENLLMPSLDSIEGISEEKAEAIAAALKDGPFLSVEDFINRTKVSKDAVYVLVELGLLSGMPGHH